LIGLPGLADRVGGRDLRALTTNFGRRNKLFALAVSAIPLGLCSTASADRYWKNGVTADTWSSSTDWSAVSPSGTDDAASPSFNDNAYITNTDALGEVVTLDTSASVISLQIGNTGGGTDTLVQGGTFSFSTNTETVGIGTDSVGVYTQSGGVNSWSSALILGSGTSSFGTYNLSGTGSIDAGGGSTTGLYVGDSGTGVFNQSAGTVLLSFGANGNLFVGYNGTGVGTYALSGGSLSGTGSAFIGYNGNGTLTQSAGSISFANSGTGSMYLGYDGTGAGTYLISGGTLNLSNAEYVGYSGAGTVSQTGGAQTVNSVQLGYNGAGTYSLSSGTLTAAVSEIVGVHGAGTFSQTGGVNIIGTRGNPGLLLGYVSGGTGTFLLSGTGSLAVNGYEYIGWENIGTFIQSGGINAVGTTASPQSLDLGVESGSGGTYLLNGTGSLVVNGSVFVGGSGNGSGGSGSFAISAGSASISSSLVLYSSGALSQTGGYLSALSFVQYGGTASFNGLNVDSTSGPGGNIGGYGLEGGTLTVGGAEYVGNSGTGAVDQIGGSHTVGTTVSPQSLYIAYGASSAGTFTLSGTGSLSVTGAEYVGDSGAGTFAQSGGFVTLSSTSGGNLWLGYGTTGFGTYLLSGGTLTVNGNEGVGYNGAGTFNQTGGIQTVGTSGSPKTLAVGYDHAVGTYTLSSGTVNVVGAEVVGYGTAGTFSQSGGIQVIGGGSATAPNLDLGFYPIPHASSIETLLND
jgi:hypothetical protein